MQQRHERTMSEAQASGMLHIDTPLFQLDMPPAPLSKAAPPPPCGWSSRGIYPPPPPWGPRSIWQAPPPQASHSLLQYPPYFKQLCYSRLAGECPSELIGDALVPA